MRKRLFFLVFLVLLGVAGFAVAYPRLIADSQNDNTLTRPGTATLAGY